MGHPKAWKLEAKFADGYGAKEFLSPDVRFFDPGWGGEVFKRGIESLTFHLPIGMKIYMEGMEAYNFFVEASRGLAGGSIKIDAFWLLGKLPLSQVTEIWRISDGKVIRQRGMFGKEWGGGPTRGWKKGIAKSNVISEMQGH